MPWTLRELELQASSNLLREELWENSCFIINPWNFLLGNKTQLLKLLSKTLIKDTDAGGTWPVGPWNKIHRHHVLQSLLEEERHTHALFIKKHRIKIIVHPKMYILPSTHQHVIPNLTFILKWRNAEELWWWLKLLSFKKTTNHSKDAIKAVNITHVLL